MANYPDLNIVKFSSIQNNFQFCAARGLFHWSDSSGKECNTAARCLRCSQKYEVKNCKNKKTLFFENVVLIMLLYVAAARPISKS